MKTRSKGQKESSVAGVTGGRRVDRNEIMKRMVYKSLMCSQTRNSNKNMEKLRNGRRDKKYTIMEIEVEIYTYLSNRQNTFSYIF